MIHSGTCGDHHILHEMLVAVSTIAQYASMDVMSNVTSAIGLKFLPYLPKMINTLGYIIKVYQS